MQTFELVKANAGAAGIDLGSIMDVGLFLKRSAGKQPTLFTYWRLGMVNDLLDGSGVSREVHAPFCESLGLQCSGLLSLSNSILLIA